MNECFEGTGIEPVSPGPDAAMDGQSPLAGEDFAAGAAFGASGQGSASALKSKNDGRTVVMYDQ